MFRPTRVKIDREALKSNFKILQKWNGPVDFFCPMVKANAYGHGAVEVAHQLERLGAKQLGVALVEEGLQLRTAGIQIPILVFAPFNAPAASAMYTHQLTPVITRFEDLEALAALRSKTPIGVHLKFNTGMCRLGFDVGELPRLHIEIAQQTQLRVDGVCTHLTHGDEAHLTDSITQTQLSRLHQMGQGFPGVRHAHKSSSLAALVENSQNKPPGVGTRPGISLYGLPYETSRTAPGLRPILSWVTQLARVHSVEPGTSVGYGARWRAMRPSKIGVVPVGYGDGYMRALGNSNGGANAGHCKGEMLFRGGRVPVVGSVCMDYTLLDLTDCCNEGSPLAGEEIVLIGRQGKGEITAGILAERAGTIAYEIVTNISSRVMREVD